VSLRTIFKALSEFFKRERMDFGIIGAFALYSYGYVRATRDIDFITRSEYKSRVIFYLESLGFETIYNSEAFSNHLHPIGSVRVDVMYADTATADAIFSDVKDRIVFEGLELPVVSAEHLIAMKLFAVQNNPERRFKDFADIKEILNRTEWDRKKVRDYFSKYGQTAYYQEITGESANDERY
jgi:hypothetical protein